MAEKRVKKLAGNLVRTLPVAPNKFNNNSTKQYYEKNCDNFELCIWKLFKNVLSCLDTSKAPAWTEYCRNFLALTLCNPII